MIWTNKLPNQSAKGEILSIQALDFPLEGLSNFPFGDNVSLFWNLSWELKTQGTTAIAVGAVGYFVACISDDTLKHPTPQNLRQIIKSRHLNIFIYSWVQLYANPEHSDGPVFDAVISYAFINTRLDQSKKTPEIWSFLQLVIIIELVLLLSKLKK